MVYRLFTEKRKPFAKEAADLRDELRDMLGISALTDLRIVNRYDVEGIDEKLMDACKGTVFSEAQVDTVSADLLLKKGDKAFCVEYLPGQFDQRAESAAECVQLISQGEKPLVRTAKVYILSGEISEEEFQRIKKYLINPVEAREASFDRKESLAVTYEKPGAVPVLSGFISLTEEELLAMCTDLGLAMDQDDLRLCRDYFAALHRDPTMTEIRLIDTYWSDHCRHTTFHTHIDKIRFCSEKIERTYQEYLEVKKKRTPHTPVTLMDMASIAAKDLKAQGLLDKLDTSDEINACTVKIDVTVDGKKEKWLLLFKNETHNHPTEIEPFGGAATCIGGAIRDPLSGRGYVYAAMRITGAADPLQDLSETLEGKLAQRQIVTKSANGYSSYGNQIGLATGLVDEVYHPGYLAKRMEVGAVIAATPEDQVVREEPIPGDLVLLLGGRTGRDGIGGATGSSKAHTTESLERCGAEVQKGNAPEERKLQRLFRNPEASRLIKRCNDFGAGGVSVAIGELAPGLQIDLDKVTKKYEGLDGTELAISESQERMAVVVNKDDAPLFRTLCEEENIEATVVAQVIEEPSFRLQWRGEVIADIERAFLDTNGAEKHIEIDMPEYGWEEPKQNGTFRDKYMDLINDLNICSKRGLAERFDSTIGGGTVLMPFGGRKQRTPIQTMVHLIPLEEGKTDDCSCMTWAFDPLLSAADPYDGAYLAVIHSVAKLVASGASIEDTYLSFQEYFPKPGKDKKRWAAPLAAILGAFQAQRELGIGSIGGKDSMSGTFEDLDVPPTLLSFAVTMAKTDQILSPEFKGTGHKVYLLEAEKNRFGLPTGESLQKLFSRVHDLIRAGKVISAYTPGFGGIAEAIFKMAIGNEIGFTFDERVEEEELFRKKYGSFLLEMAEGESCDGDAILLGRTAGDRKLSLRNDFVSLYEIEKIYEEKLESVYPTRATKAGRRLEAKEGEPQAKVETYRHESLLVPHASIRITRPRVLIPVFPGTNCEYDTARAFAEAGAEPDIFIVNNLSADHVRQSVRNFAVQLDRAQMLFIPGGFSGGDEPDGSGKFITAFLRNPEIRRSLERLMNERAGLIAGICNGFQALIKLGLVPYGKIIDQECDNPTLTFNEIGRHQSKLVRTIIASNMSPWLKETQPGQIFTIPVSHGEGRFIASQQCLDSLAQRGQIATQYVDQSGEATLDIDFNPNGSVGAVEGLTSPDGRIFGKMGHSERVGAMLYKNVPGQFDMGLFRSAVRYFK